MRLFGSERLMDVFTKLGVEEGEQIEHKMLSSAIEKAQKKIESNNFGIRKNLLEYDQVMNEQREIIYDERQMCIRDRFCEVNPIPVKKALNLMGWQAGPLRMPLTEMTEAHTAQLAKELEAFGIKLA